MFKPGDIVRPISSSLENKDTRIRVTHIFEDIFIGVLVQYPDKLYLGQVYHMACKDWLLMRPTGLARFIESQNKFREEILQ